MTAAQLGKERSAHTMCLLWLSPEATYTAPIHVPWLSQSHDPTTTAREAGKLETQMNMYLVGIAMFPDIH